MHGHKHKTHSNTSHTQITHMWLADLHAYIAHMVCTGVHVYSVACACCYVTTRYRLIHVHAKQVTG